jgi:hypothetical protein
MELHLQKIPKNQALNKLICSLKCLLILRPFLAGNSFLFLPLTVFILITVQPTIQAQQTAPESPPGIFLEDPIPSTAMLDGSEPAVTPPQSSASSESPQAQPPESNSAESTVENPLPTPEEIIPRPYTADRYQSLWARSPFMLPSIVVDTPVRVAGLEQKFILQSVTVIEGKPIVTLHSKDRQTSITISDEPLESENGLRVVAIDDSKVTVGGINDITKLVVKIANNNEQGEISFEPAMVAQAGGFPAGIPGMAGMPPGVFPQATMQPMPPPSVPASISAISPSSDDNSSTTIVPPSPPPASQHQRRQMVIPSTPPPDSL